MKKVLCCIPTLGSIRIELAQRLYQWKARYRDYFDVYTAIGKPIIDARNECVQTFLEGDAPYLFFIDSDIVPPIEAIDMLLSHGFNKKIVGGLCFTIKPDSDGGLKKIPVALRKVVGGYKITDKELKGLIEVDATGAACLMIHKSVFDDCKMSAPWFYTLAEDFYFCEKAKEAGFSVYIDCNCNVVHYKVVGL